MRRASRTVALHASAPRDRHRVGGGGGATPPRWSSRRSPRTTPRCAPATGRTTAPRPRTSSTAWERSRTATFVRTGTFERRSEVTGSSISSEDVLAQRPPRRLHRQLGGVSGRDDRRLARVPAAPPTGSTPSDCTLGEPSGPSYEEDVASEVAALRTLVTGDVARLRRRGGVGGGLLRAGAAAGRAEGALRQRGPVLLRRGHRRTGQQPGRLRGWHRRGGRGHRAARARRPTRTWNPEGVTTGGRRPRHGSGSVGSGSMQLEGVATPVPFP